MSERVVILYESRRALRLTQSQIAKKIGVCKQVYSTWERGAPIPAERRVAVAQALKIDVEALKAIVRAAVSPQPVTSRHVQRHSQRRDYPIGATVGEMELACPRSREIVLRTKAALPPEQYRILAHEYPRDTPYELLAVFDSIDHGFELVWSSGARAGCPWLIMKDFLPEYGGHQLQPALLWEREDENILIFGQVRLKAPFVKWGARVDFLVRYKRTGRRAQWMYVELDGRDHILQPGQDGNRAEGLLIPELRYDNHRVRNGGWFARFLDDIREAAADGARRERKRKTLGKEMRQERIDSINNRGRAAA
jgi:transcriptional regulator with XRE-family HTH domain